ncbi:MAG: winged helix-turn-helix domain-containing protein [Gammaproteobacteria bacterium]
MLELDQNRFCVDGVHASLTRTEYLLLQYLFVNRGKTVSVGELVEHVYSGGEADPNLIARHLANIRKKVGADTVRTESNRGYLAPMSNDSLAKRIARLAALFAIFALTSNGFVLWWQTRENVNQALDQHLAAYNDFLLTATRFVNGQLEFLRSRRNLGGDPEVLADNIQKWTAVRFVKDDGDSPGRRRSEYRNGEKGFLSRRSSSHCSSSKYLHVPKRAKSHSSLTGLDVRWRMSMCAIHGKIITAFIAGRNFAALVLFNLRVQFAENHNASDMRFRKTSNPFVAVSHASFSELYPLEIRNLTSSLNALLKQDAVKVKRQREAMTNLAHSLRTPLTVIANDASTSLVREKVRDILQLLDRVLVRAQSGSSSAALVASAPVRKVAEKVVQSYAKLYQKQGLVNIDTEIEFTGDEADLYEMLGNAIENAGRCRTVYLQR